jgi:carbamate kinase (EC 2.7.2.2)
MSAVKRRLALIAFGGNALLSEKQKGTQEEQIANAEDAARLMAAVVRKGYELIIVHGNGPQVGNLLIQQEAAADHIPPLFPRSLRRHDRRQHGLHAGTGPGQRVPAPFDR